MAKNVTFKLNRNGIRELMKSREITDECRAYADSVVAYAGEDLFESLPFEGQNRNGFHVHPKDAHGYYSNLKNNTLERAIGAAKK